MAKQIGSILDLVGNRITGVGAPSAASDTIRHDDARLSNTRTPSAHAASHGSGQADAVTIAESQVTNLVTDLSGKATAVHTHAAADVASGNLDTARLGATPAATTYLKGAASGAATWVVPATLKTDLALNNVANVDQTNASNLASGTVPQARLGASGTRDTTTFLRGDNAFAVPPDNNTTYTAGAGLALTGTVFSVGVGGVDSNMIANGSVALSDLSATGTKDATTFLRGDNAFAVPPAAPTGPMSTWEASCTAATDSLTTAQDVTGCTVTVPVAATTDKFLVVMTANIQALTSNTLIATAILTVNGVDQAQNIVVSLQSQINSRVTAHQNYMVTGLPVGNVVFKMTMGATTTGATYRINSNHSRFTVTKLEGAVGPTGAPGSGSVVVRAATNSNNALNSVQTVDGVTCTVGDRILVKAQTSAAANGVYVMASGTWTRATDFNTSAQAAAQSVVVQGGLTSGGTVWQTTFKASDTLDTTAMNWLPMSPRQSTWVPVFTGATTNPVDGTGATKSGVYTLQGGLCTFSLFYNVGSGGAFNAGSGLLSFSLPIAATQYGTIVGHTRLGGAGNPIPWMSETSPGSTTLAIRKWPTTAGGATLNTAATDNTAGTLWYAQGSYFYSVLVTGP